MIHNYINHYDHYPCISCGRKFKSELDAQVHAARTKHANFSESTDEIKPMTAEEKQEALAR